MSINDNRSSMNMPTYHTAKCDCGPRPPLSWEFEDFERESEPILPSGSQKNGLLKSQFPQYVTAILSDVAFSPVFGFKPFCVHGVQAKGTVVVNSAVVHYSCLFSRMVWLVPT